jgi:hypothetical protein
VVAAGTPGRLPSSCARAAGGPTIRANANNAPHRASSGRWRACRLGRFWSLCIKALEGRSRTARHREGLSSSRRKQRPERSSTRTPRPAFSRVTTATAGLLACGSSSLRRLPGPRYPVADDEGLSAHSCGGSHGFGKELLFGANSSPHSRFDPRGEPSLLAWQSSNAFVNRAPTLTFNARRAMVAASLGIVPTVDGPGRDRYPYR